MISTLGMANEPVNEPAKLQLDKRMVKNFIKSLIIPGWGQWENGHKIRGLVFVTAEIAGIYGYQNNTSLAEDKEAEFKLFGDAHWYYGRWSPSNDGETACGGNLRTHQMPTLTDGSGNFILDAQNFQIPLKDHHFYENISKYPEFSCGWDDFTLGINYDYNDDDDTNKSEYIDMRTRSNALYRNAQVAGTLIMLNHLISAFDAALETDLTSFESSSFAGKVYINPLNVVQGISMEVRF